jgi:hypothetical protein
MTTPSGLKLTLAQAGTLVEEFGRGFFGCAATDHTSLLYVGLGTNNSGGTVNAAAGAALATQAKSVDAKFATAQQQRQSYAVGASDFEGWSSGTGTKDAAAKAWFSGYTGVSGRPIFFDYGSADECSTSGEASKVACSGGLSASAIWTVSWSGPAWPVPEMYNAAGTSAKQWMMLSVYSKAVKGSAMSFESIMTQQGACSQVKDEKKTQAEKDAVCKGVNNSPATALTLFKASGGSVNMQVTDITWGR